MKRKILIVDDNQDMKPIYELAFENSGFDLTVITSSLEAQSYLDKVEVDAVLIDLAMPEMDGLTLAKQIRINEDKNGNKNRARLAWFTGRNIGEVERRVGRRVGIEETFTKPKDPYELVRDVRAWLNEPPPTEIKRDKTEFSYRQNGAVVPTMTTAVIGIVVLIVTITIYNRVLHTREEEYAYQFVEQKKKFEHIERICNENWRFLIRPFYADDSPNIACHTLSRFMRPPFG